MKSKEPAEKKKKKIEHEVTKRKTQSDKNAKIREKERGWKKVLCKKVSKIQKENGHYGLSGLERYSQRMNLPHSNLTRLYFLRLNRATIYRTSFK